MTNLRILLVDGDDRRAERLTALLASGSHSALAISTVSDAAEVLSIQRFDAVLFAAAEPCPALSSFAAALRRQELEQKQELRTVLLSCSPENESSCLDGHLAPDFTSAQLAAAVAACSATGPASQSQNGIGAPELPVFLPDQFEEQCVHDPDLMIEVIGLFFAERESQLTAMAEALGANSFELLSRVAHTLKGSLGSLHAPLARRRIEELEFAARARNGALCAQILERIEEDLATLDAQLAAFRQACQCR